MIPRVLLVEDDPATRTFLQMATRALEVEVDAAASMQQALALAAHTCYAAWLLDAWLPDGSGPQLLATLRQSRPDVPALAHTATDDQAQLQRLRDAGFEMVVCKPLSAADWRAAVCALLTGTASPAASPLPLWDDAAALKVLGHHPADLAALRGLFMDELPQQLSRLEQAQHQQDQSAIQAELHRLRASCGFVGAARLAAAIASWSGQAERLHTIVHTTRQMLACPAQ